MEHPVELAKGFFLFVICLSEIETPHASRKSSTPPPEIKKRNQMSVLCGDERKGDGIIGQSWAKSNFVIFSTFETTPKYSPGTLEASHRTSNSANEPPRALWLVPTVGMLNMHKPFLYFMSAPHDRSGTPIFEHLLVSLGLGRCWGGLGLLLGLGGLCGGLGFRRGPEGLNMVSKINDILVVQLTKLSLKSCMIKVESL